MSGPGSGFGLGLLCRTLRGFRHPLPSSSSSLGQRSTTGFRAIGGNGNLADSAAADGAPADSPLTLFGSRLEAVDAAAFLSGPQRGSTSGLGGNFISGNDSWDLRNGRRDFPALTNARGGMGRGAWRRCGPPLPGGGSRKSRAWATLAAAGAGGATAVSAVGVAATGATPFLALAFVCGSVACLCVLLAVVAVHSRGCGGGGGEEEVQGADSARTAADEPCPGQVYALDARKRIATSTLRPKELVVYVDQC